MPIFRRRDADGPFYQWGDRGAKYHYISGNKRSREFAYNKAAKQAGAAYAHGYRGK